MITIGELGYHKGYFFGGWGFGCPWAGFEVPGAPFGDVVGFDILFASFFLHFFELLISRDIFFNESIHHFVDLFFVFLY